MHVVRVGLFAAVVGGAGCGRVVFDDEVGSSGEPGIGEPSGATTSTGLDGPASSSADGAGGGAASSTSSSAQGGGASGDGGAAGDGGAGGGRPVESCRSLTWSAPVLATVSNPVSYGVHLHDRAHGHPRALFVGKLGDPTSGSWRVRYRSVGNAWAGDLHMGGSVRTWHGADGPFAMGQGRGGVDAHVLDPAGPALTLIERAPTGAVVELPLPADMAPVQDFAWSGASDGGAYAVVGGVERLAVAVVSPDDVAPPSVNAVAIDACADRRVAHDVAAADGGFVLVHASDGAGCGAPDAGPPTVARVARIDLDGTVIPGDSIDVGAPIASLHLVPISDGSWLGVRAEGAGSMALVRVRSDGSIGERTDLPLAPDRRVTMARRLDDLVLVDMAGGDGAAPWVRTRLVGLDLAVRADASTDAGDVHPENGFAALGAPDGSAVLVGFWSRALDGTLQSGLIRATCGGP